MDINAYLDAHENKSLLRILTCGSVDDGKSTLIGRLLYDSKLIFDDQLAALRRDSDRSGTTGAGEIDYALLLDGLKAEREQGITIDVAYRYFSTPKRKFIIADCPGHEEYTRNMATGASTADLAIILVDARSGVITQTRRHSFIVSLLGIRHVVVAVNKMDLVGYSEERFREIRDDYLAFAKELDIPDLHFIPLSALKGTNVVERVPELTPYYGGPALLELLEGIETASDTVEKAFRFPVQCVIRPNLDFRGFAGSVASGVVRKGDEVVALPSGKRSRVKAIVTADGDLDYAFAPQAITLTLEDEIDISTGDWIVKSGELPRESNLFRADLIWMAQHELLPGKPYLIRHGAGFVKGRIREITRRIDVNTLERGRADSLALNGIAEVVVETTRPLSFDPYGENRATGRVILVDPVSNATAGAGMIIDVADARDSLPSRVNSYRNGYVSPEQRAGSQRHRGGALLLVGRDAAVIAAELEQKLFRQHVGCYALSIAAPEHGRDRKFAELAVIARAFADAGTIFLTALPSVSAEEAAALVAPVVALDGARKDAALVLSGSDGTEAKLEKIVGLLTERGYLPDFRAWNYSI